MLSFLHVLLTIMLFCAKFALVISLLGLVLIGIDLAWHERKGYKNEVKRETERENHAADTKNHVTDMLRKEKIRREKEAAAHEGFFEESYVRGFHPDGSLWHRPQQVPTHRALEYYRIMEELETTQADLRIFENTEEL
jgi:hypothetical protein